jgi:hypothetical protein
MPPMTRDLWIERFAALLGVDAPDADTIETLLNLAGVAAHASERTAAPVACWLAARAGVLPDHALATAESVPTD